MLKKLTTGLLLVLAVLAGNTVADATGNDMTVLVTGANRGIGLELARQLQARGYSVIGTARKPDAAVELRELGVRVEQLDVTDAPSVRALAQKLEGVPIDLLINNAGISGHRADSFRETDIDRLVLTFDVNSLGPMRVTQALLDNLESGRGKTVVQISTIMGSIANNGGGHYGYRASKAALNMLNSSLALELAGQGFVCVAMHPGWVKTRMGGPSAMLSTEQSVTGMLAVIEKLDSDSNGRFLDYQGNELPW